MEEEGSKKGKEVMSTIKKTELENGDESHSEVSPLTEDKTEKLIQVYLSLEQYEQFMVIQAFYRSPSISHTLRLMIEDINKGLKEGLYQQMVKTLHQDDGVKG